MRKITIEEIKEAIHKQDLLLRPYAVFLHPEDAEDLINCLPEIEKDVLIQATPCIEKGKGICIKREELESWAKGMWEADQ